MKSKNTGVRLEDTTREELKKRAMREGKTISTYAAELITQALSNQQRIDLMVANIHEDCLQFESMLSIMQGYSKVIHSILLGRTEPPKFANADELAITKEKRRRAEKMVNDIQSQTISSLLDGDDFWGQRRKGESKDEK